MLEQLKLRRLPGGSGFAIENIPKIFTDIPEIINDCIIKMPEDIYPLVMDELKTQYALFLGSLIKPLPHIFQDY